VCVFSVYVVCVVCVMCLRCVCVVCVSVVCVRVSVCVLSVYRCVCIWPTYTQNYVTNI